MVALTTVLAELAELRLLIASAVDVQMPAALLSSLMASPVWTNPFALPIRLV